MKALILAVGVAAAAAATTGAQEIPETPLAGAGGGEQSPDGSRLDATYETFAGGLALLPPGAVDSVEAVAPVVAEWVQPRLPEGFSLGQASTHRTMVRADALSTARLTGAQATPSGSGSPAKLVTSFPLQFENVPLSKGSDFLALLSADGRLLATRTRGLPTEVDATRPTVSPAEAVAAARDHAVPAIGDEDGEAGTPRLEIWVDRENKGTLTWTFSLRATSLSSPFARQYWVEATGEPSIVHWESQIFHDHRGRVTATVWETTPLEATGESALPHLGVTRLAGGNARVFTNDEGEYLIPGGAQDAQIHAALAGISCVSRDQRGNQLERIAAGTAAAPIDLAFDAGGELELSQTSGYFWCDFAHSFAQLPAQVLRIITVRVNIEAACNAFYSSSDVSVNFFRAGGGCPNTAYSDIVLHEYGHAVDDERGGILDGGYSEGFGDALAILGTRQSCAGRDLFGAGSCLRDASDVVTWPPASNQVHQVGRIYASFVQELVEQLSRTLSEDEAYAVATDLVLAADAGNPADIPDAVRLMFLADDDDGNPATCSPHFLELTSAAAARRIPRPPGGNAPGTLEVRMTTVPADDPGRFNVRLDGGSFLANAGDGATSGPRPVSPGVHRVTQTGAGGTDLSDYRTFLGGGCSADGQVTVRSCLPRVCTITNLLDGGDCRQECRDERDLCMEDPTMLPRICVELLRVCLASCN